MDLRTRPLPNSPPLFTLHPPYCEMGAVTRAGLSLASLLCISGAIVMLFLLVLAGSRDLYPLNQIFFLKADTRGIPGAPNGIAQWSLYNVCSSTANGANICPPPTAAYPFDPIKNFGTTTNVPAGFVTNSSRYFYLSRFLYAFYIIDLVSCFCALAAGIGAVCSRRAAWAAAATAAAATLCCAFSACVMTACFVLGAREWRNAGREAGVGVKACAFSWAVVVLVGLAGVGWLVGALVGRRRRGERGRGEEGFSRVGGVKRGRMGEGQEREKVGGPGETESMWWLRPEEEEAPVVLNTNGRRA